MEIFDSLKQLFDTIDEKKLRLYALAAGGGVIIIFGILIFQFYSSIASLKNHLRMTNSRRNEVNTLLERYYLVKKQQAQVDAVLAKEKDFKISQAFERLLQTTGISNNKAQEPETTSQQVLDGYTEWALYANLINLNMKKLTELLYAIEQEERIYTKELEIEKANDRTINVKITIATLEPKNEAQETVES